MAKKKSQTKKQRGGASLRGGAKTSSGPKDLGDVGVGVPPSEDDPKGRAEYFLQMLDAFAQQGTAEATKVRSMLIGAIAEYSERAKENKEEALTKLKATLYGLEAGVMELLIRSTSKLRDKITEQASKLGTKSQAGKNARAAADGMSSVVEALSTMLRAANEGSQQLRDRANAMMEKARETMGGIG